jgi:hypothetical protein
MFISLSSSYVSYACGIKQSIINYVENTETNFFDWLCCSMKSINEILEKKEILFEENYIYPNPLNTVSIKFKNFDLLLSHHDITIFDENSINNITIKYNKRYERLINIIKTQNKIFFIRHCLDNNNIEELEIYKFYENIININKYLDFYFILVSDCDNLILNKNLINKKNFIYINLNNYINNDINNETDNYKKIIKKYKYIYEYLNLIGLLINNNYY